jgi:hypothetical protein
MDIMEFKPILQEIGLGIKRSKVESSRTGTGTRIHLTVSRGLMKPQVFLAVMEKNGCVFATVAEEETGRCLHGTVPVESKEDLGPLVDALNVALREV